jgi:hypothetical protein
MFAEKLGPCDATWLLQAHPGIEHRNGTRAVKEGDIVGHVTYPNRAFLILSAAADESENDEKNGVTRTSRLVRQPRSLNVKVSRSGREPFNSRHTTPVVSPDRVHFGQTRCKRGVTLR